MFIFGAMSTFQDTNERKIEPVDKKKRRRTDERWERIYRAAPILGVMWNGAMPWLMFNWFLNTVWESPYSSSSQTPRWASHHWLGKAARGQIGAECLPGGHNLPMCPTKDSCNQDKQSSAIQRHVSSRLTLGGTWQSHFMLYPILHLQDLQEQINSQANIRSSRWWGTSTSFGMVSVYTIKNIINGIIY